MANTFLDELAEYPVKALQKIGTDETIVQLLTDNPLVDMESDEADSVFDKYLFDYGYVDGTAEEASAYICVEAEVTKNISSTMKDMRLFVTIYCHKDFMHIDATKFKGLSGNRRENLTRFVDNLLNGSDIFGVGELTLLSARVVPAPVGFAAREMTYRVPDFREKRMKGVKR